MAINTHLAGSHVRYNAERTRIVHYRCFKPTLGFLSSAQIDVARESIVHDLKNGKRIITVIQNADGEWEVGEDVHLVSNGGIRTDANDTADDNLGQLPEIKGQLLNRP